MCPDIVKIALSIEEIHLYSSYTKLLCSDCFHLQLVWGATNQFAMAKAKARDVPNVYVVARYKPAGNVVNQFQMNVKPKPQ